MKDITYNIEILKDKIKDDYKYYTYKIENKNIKLIFKSLSINDTKDEIKEKYLDNSNNWFIVCKISTHRGIGFNQGGPVCLTSNIYIINNNKLINPVRHNNDEYEKYYYMTGQIWFTEKYLEKNGWTIEYINDIVNKLVLGKKKISKKETTIYSL
jgi:hypothetical protein